MRQIKFRAWDIEQKRWAIAAELKEIGCVDLLKNILVLQNENSENYVLQQFTGLLDKNGKEIYEGDVVHLTKGWHTVENDAREKYTGEDFIEGEVKYFTPYAGFGISGIGFDKLSLFPIEIIGNIYENPELLK